MKYTKVNIRRKRVLNRILSFLIQYPKDKYELRSHLIDELKEVIEDTEKSYPEEFIRWLSIKIKSLDIKLGLPVMYRLNDKTYELPELYDFWLNEIKDK